jgi:hypothetical protein
MAFIVNTLQSYSRRLYEKEAKKERIKEEIQHEKAVQYYF